MQTVLPQFLILVVCLSNVYGNDSDITFQKRQSLIPFPRVGRSRIGVNGNRMSYFPASRNFQWEELREGKRHLIPFPRVGKRQSLIPFPRVGRSFTFNDYDDFNDNELQDVSFLPFSSDKERRKRSSGMPWNVRPSLPDASLNNNSNSKDDLFIRQALQTTTNDNPLANSLQYRGGRTLFIPRLGHSQDQD